MIEVVTTISVYIYLYLYVFLQQWSIVVIGIHDELRIWTGSIDRGFFKKDIFKMKEDEYARQFESLLS